MVYCREHLPPLPVAVGSAELPTSHWVAGLLDLEGLPTWLEHVDLGMVLVDENLAALLLEHGSAQAVLDFLGEKYSSAMA